MGKFKEMSDLEAELEKTLEENELLKKSLQNLHDTVDRVTDLSRKAQSNLKKLNGTLEADDLWELLEETESFLDAIVDEIPF